MKKIVMASVMLVLISACSEQAVREDMPENTGEQSGAQAGSIADSGAAGGTMLAGQNYRVSYEPGAINDPGNILSQKTVYFEFDSSEIRADYAELVKHHGKYLALNSNARARLEGHTDERGSREYNIALADRRAQTVKRLLSFEGVRADQMNLISYGEEKPAAFGQDEQAYSLNRRVELVYE